MKLISDVFSILLILSLTCCKETNIQQQGLNSKKNIINPFQNETVDTVYYLEEEVLLKYQKLNQIIKSDVYLNEGSKDEIYNYYQGNIVIRLSQENYLQTIDEQTVLKNIQANLEQYQILSPYNIEYENNLLKFNFNYCLLESDSCYRFLVELNTNSHHMKMILIDH